MKGIVDRIEGEYVVVELENKEIMNIKKSKVPLVEEGDVLIISRDNISIDKKETYERKKLIEEKFKKLFE